MATSIRSCHSASYHSALCRPQSTKAGRIIAYSSFSHLFRKPCQLNSISRAVVMRSGNARVADDVYMQEYADLKTNLMTTTRQSGAAVAAYLLVTAGGATSICALIGMGFSNIYLLWMFRDVDAVSPNDYVPMFEAKKIDSPVARTLAIWAASYYHSLRPRLLVPISLAALMAAWNYNVETPLTGLQEAGLLLGFLSHKFALLLKVADAVSPKEYGEQSSRPKIEKMEDDSFIQLDRWGRPKAASFTMPTEALPDDVDPNNPGLLPSLLIRAAEGVDDSSTAGDSKAHNTNSTPAGHN